MKTAIELAKELMIVHNGHADEGPSTMSDAAAMLRQQAERIDALKADAERYQWWVTQVEHKDFENLEKAFKSMEAREDVTKQMMDAAIDSMKGQK